jgi:hypothetical protein
LGLLVLIIIKRGRRGGKGCVPYYASEEGVGVLDGEDCVADVDEVVFVFGVDPFFFEIVDEEMDVFGDEIGLDGREVDAGYCGGWVFVTDCVLVSFWFSCARNLQAHRQLSVFTIACLAST